MCIMNKKQTNILLMGYNAIVVLKCTAAEPAGQVKHDLLKGFSSFSERTKFTIAFTKLCSRLTDMLKS